jgi:hypothetical protein
MIHFPANDPILQGLFDPNLPNSPALWAVLYGNHTGKAVVDSTQNPSQCVLRTNAALTYFSVRTGQAFLNQATAFLGENGPVWLVWPHKTWLHPPEGNDVEIVNRLEFCETNPGILDNLRRQLPDGYSVRKIDEQLLERCEWRAEMEFYAGSLRSFLKHGIGLCMMNENEIIVEAYASSLGKTRAEIGAITHETFRGRSYAPIACAFLIEECQQRGYQAYWSCDTDNIASIRVAQKLGFKQMRAYKIFEYP